MKLITAVKYSLILFFVYLNFPAYAEACVNVQPDDPLYIYCENRFIAYQKSADKGHASAQTNLARMYHHGEYVEKDLEKALHWYSKAAEAGDEDAKKKVAQFHEKGIGVGEKKSSQKKKGFFARFFGK